MHHTLYFIDKCVKLNEIRQIISKWDWVNGVWYGMKIDNIILFMVWYGVCELYFLEILDR
jgi:hypothetical protein